MLVNLRKRPLGILLRLDARVLRARARKKLHIKSTVPRIAALVAEKRIEHFVVDVAALAALKNILVAVLAQAVTVGDVATAPRALKRFAGGDLQVCVELLEFHHDRVGSDRQRELALNLGIPGRQMRRVCSLPQIASPSQSAQILGAVGVVNGQLFYLSGSPCLVNRKREGGDGLTMRQTHENGVVRVLRFRFEGIELEALVLRFSPKR
mmetsp:Transcript_884/g.3289  ORF Transcript_884/g.3289 Transcript_884/m.3289 type:complete len:209 (+) Transcript_884:720-1346(+)